MKIGGLLSKLYAISVEESFKLTMTVTAFKMKRKRVSLYILCSSNSILAAAAPSFSASITVTLFAVTLAESLLIRVVLLISPNPTLQRAFPLYAEASKHLLVKAAFLDGIRSSPTLAKQGREVCQRKKTEGSTAVPKSTDASSYCAGGSERKALLCKEIPDLMNLTASFWDLLGRDYRGYKTELLENVSPLKVSLKERKASLLVAECPWGKGCWSAAYGPCPHRSCWQFPSKHWEYL